MKVSEAEKKLVSQKAFIPISTNYNHFVLKSNYEGVVFSFLSVELAATNKDSQGPLCASTKNESMNQRMFLKLVECRE